jgi:hypothetical protein
LLDGRLTGTERVTLVDHLADCGLCFSVFASTSQTLAGDRPPEESRRPRARSLARVAAALAFLTLSVLAILVGRSRLATGDDVAPPAPTLASALAGSYGDRGLGPSNETDLDRIHPGALELHLALALIEGRRGAAADLAARLTKRARQAGAADDTIRVLQSLAEELSTDRPSSLQLPDTLIAKTFGARSTEATRCGEAARIAWQANAADWFSSPLGLACRRTLLRRAEPQLASQIARAWPESGALVVALPALLRRMVEDGAL